VARVAVITLGLTVFFAWALTPQVVGVAAILVGGAILQAWIHARRAGGGLAQKARRHVLGFVLGVGLAGATVVGLYAATYHWAERACAPALDAKSVAERRSAIDAFRAHRPWIDVVSRLTSKRNFGLTCDRAERELEELFGGAKRLDGTTAAGCPTFPIAGIECACGQDRWPTDLECRSGARVECRPWDGGLVCR
jgi:hypothetical protein